MLVLLDMAGRRKLQTNPHTYVQYIYMCTDRCIHRDRKTEKMCCVTVPAKNA